MQPFKQHGRCHGPGVSPAAAHPCFTSSPPSLNSLTLLTVGKCMHVFIDGGQAAAPHYSRPRRGWEGDLGAVLCGSLSPSLVILGHCRRIMLGKLSSSLSGVLAATGVQQVMMCCHWNAFQCFNNSVLQVPMATLWDTILPRVSSQYPPYIMSM